MKRKLAIVCNAPLISESLQKSLENIFHVERYNVFELVLLQLKNGNPIDLLLYIVPDYFKEDKTFLNYASEKQRLPIVVLGNNEDKRLNALQSIYRIEKVLEYSNQQLNLKEELQNVTAKAGAKPNKRAILNRFGLTANEIVLLQLYSGKNTKAEVCEMMKRSPRQIERIKKSAYQKIGVTSDFQAGRWVTTHLLWE